MIVQQVIVWTWVTRDNLAMLGGKGGTWTGLMQHRKNTYFTNLSNYTLFFDTLILEKMGLLKPKAS